MASTVLDKRYILIKSKQYRKVQKKGGGILSQLHQQGITITVLQFTYLSKEE